MFEYIKSKFRQPTPLEVITRELAEAQLYKLEAQTAFEYSHSIVDYNAARVKRLEALMAHYLKGRT